MELLDLPSDSVNQLAARLGLRPVGWIFTDLVPLDTSTGTVKHFRGNVNSHFLSAEECILAADLQAQHPNPCRLSPEGHFGSKFVTVVVTGSSIHVLNDPVWHVFFQWCLKSSNQLVLANFCSEC